jgi:uncharacterized integral membrane protein
MRIFSTVFGLILTFLVLSFSLTNRMDVVVGMWPFQTPLQMPLFVVGLAPLLFGLVFGALWGWMGGFRHRLEARRLNKELGGLKAKIGALQAPPPPQRKSSFWSRS